MNKRSAPVLDRDTPPFNGCGCFADAAPMPMGCALCGHAPYAHGCPDLSADHEYVQPDGALMNARLEARRHGGPVRLPAPRPPAEVAPVEVIPLVPAQRRPGAEAELPASAPAVPTTENPVPTEPPVEDEPAAEPEQPPAVRPARPPLPRRPRPLLPPAATRPPQRRDGGRPAPGGARGPGRTALASRPARVLVGALQRPIPHHIGRTCPTRQAPEQVLDRKHHKEVRSMHDGTTSPSTQTIPGWRLIISTAGRFWAFRKLPFTVRARQAGAEPDLDADTFAEIQAAVERQEEIARLVAAQGVES